MYTLRRSTSMVLALSLLLILPACADEFHIRPHIQNVTPDGATIIWESLVPGPGTVDFGTGTGYGESAVDESIAKIHRVRIDGLQPDATYHYRITAGEFEAASHFTTAPPAPRPTTFVLVGDSRRWGERLAETGMADHALQWNPEFFVNTGDLVADGHKYEQWPAHFERYSNLNHQYMIVTARGNHEGSRLRDTANDWFSKYHEFPGDGEPYASFDWGNTHFVIIAHEDLKKSPEWLDAHLAQVEQRHIFVIQHYPLFCTGYHSPDDSRKETGESFEEVWTVLEKYRPEKNIINVCGHTHIYERLYPLRGGQRDDRTGVPYIVQGGDIGANYAEAWSAVVDDHETLEEPTYTVFQCQEDRLDLRTFAWSPAESAIVELDYYVIWEDEAVPQAVVDSLAGQSGAALAASVTELGAMLYTPAAETLAAYLADTDPAVRQAAAKALALFGADSLAEGLLPYLSDPDVLVRRSVARSLEVAMPGEFTDDVADVVLDAGQDELTRQTLIGALQFHAPASLARDVCIDLLAPDTPIRLRERAAYALGRVAVKDDRRALLKLFAQEKDKYVLIRLAWTLNRVTGLRLSLNDKAPLAKSEPGQRDDFVKKWKKGRR